MLQLSSRSNVLAWSPTVCAIGRTWVYELRLTLRAAHVSASQRAIPGCRVGSRILTFVLFTAVLFHTKIASVRPQGRTAYPTRVMLSDTEINQTQSESRE